MKSSSFSNAGCRFIYHPNNYIFMRKGNCFVLFLMLMMPLTGCLGDNDEQRISFSDCASAWHVEFFDLSRGSFSSWDGKVEFTDSNGDTEVLESFSSDKKFVILDESLTWTLKYTFYEQDIGFIIGDTTYGGSNQHGESGTIDVQLKRMYSDESDNGGGISYSSCAPEEWQVEFIDLSSDNYNSWDGEIVFDNGVGDVEAIHSFSSEIKYVTLDNSYSWTINYTFYEHDIGFIFDGVTYGLNNQYGDSGTIRV